MISMLSIIVGCFWCYCCCRVREKITKCQQVSMKQSEKGTIEAISKVKLNSSSELTQSFWVKSSVKRRGENKTNELVRWRERETMNRVLYRSDITYTLILMLYADFFDWYILLASSDLQANGRVEKFFGKSWSDDRH